MFFVFNSLSTINSWNILVFIKMKLALQEIQKHLHLVQIKHLHLVHPRHVVFCLLLYLDSNTFSADVLLLCTRHFILVSVLYLSLVQAPWSVLTLWVFLLTCVLAFYLPFAYCILLSLHYAYAFLNCVLLASVIEICIYSIG